MSAVVSRPLKGVGRELAVRQKLACLLRITAREGWADNLAGHITVVDDESPNLFVNAWGVWWDETSASDILEVDPEGHVVSGPWDVTAAVNIHTEIHRRRADAKVVVHNHPYYATLLGVIGEAPRILHQNFAAFANELVVVDEYAGTVNNVEEGIWLADRVGDASGIILRNHGAIVTAPTIEEAAWKCAIFERMCRMTYDVVVSGKPGRDVEIEHLDALKAQLRTACPQTYWDGACRLLLASEPDVLD
jgi:ribulose-5-phosphate 4-epimerase/fuculose-1-phosphate aldolase